MSDTVDEALARLSAKTEVVERRCMECDADIESGREMREHTAKTGHPVRRIRE